LALQAHRTISSFITSRLRPAACDPAIAIMITRGTQAMQIITMRA
jgi:hypothetical protein